MLLETALAAGLTLSYDAGEAPSPIDLVSKRRLTVHKMDELPVLHLQHLQEKRIKINNKPFWESLSVVRRRVKSIGNYMMATVADCMLLI
jgi:hypothetical protein